MFLISCILILVANGVIHISSSQNLEDVPLKAKGHYVPKEFYSKAEFSEKSKYLLQSDLKHFLENMQKNMTTSVVFNDFGTKTDNEKQLKKLNNLCRYLYGASKRAADFIEAMENFVEFTKNSSNFILLQFQNMSSSKVENSKVIDYIDELNLFNVAFYEVLDEASNYISNKIKYLQETFRYFADIQMELLYVLNLQPNESCNSGFLVFLQEWSAKVFKCATRNGIIASFDIYAMTKLNSYYVLHQLEFRIQQLFNCINYKNKNIYCHFLRNYEEDFGQLYKKMEEMEMYINIKTKRNEIIINKLEQNGKLEDANRTIKCIPNGFPYVQFNNFLKFCFPIFT